MRSVFTFFAMVILALCASRAESGLVVTSYRTVAQTNGYAPTNQSQYFAEQRLENVSPAVAEVSGDWTGPNADGTPNTWHFVGHSWASSVTTVTLDSFMVEASASFEYTIDTTAEFIDPASVSTFAPGGAANYRGFFETDLPATFSIVAKLNQRGRVQLISAEGVIIFNETNSQSTPRFLALTGTLPAGRFNILATTSLGIGNQSSGINHIERHGSFENLLFSVQVPEPSLAGIGVALLTRLAARRRG